MIVNMFILLYSHSMMLARGVLARDLSAAYSLLSPTPISPIPAPSEEQKDHEDNKNEVHIFLPNNLAGVFPPAHVDAEFYSPASDSTYASGATWRRRSGLHCNLITGGLQVTVKDEAKFQPLRDGTRLGCQQ